MTTRDYSANMGLETNSILTKGESTAGASLLREMPSLRAQHAVSVRTAKAHLSALLEQVATGQEVLITSDGVPKARLVPVSTENRRPFLGTRAHLAAMPAWSGGKSAEEIIREDRDSRD